jgi:hypothetical protein
VNEALKCSCFLCDSEHSLLLELSREDALRKYRDFASGRPVLSGFPTALALLHRLRAIAADDDHQGSSDAILGELVRPQPNQDHELQQHLLLLILMPALHKTSRQISAGFPSIAREDIAQHLLTTVLEILRSNSLGNQRSHFAFVAIRLLRRNSFRWALRETKLGGSVEPDPSESERRLETDMDFETKFLLNEFLSRCLSNQQINHSEYQLLISFKVEGIDAKELAAPLGLSEIAFRHRMQRILDRLRKIAREPSFPTKRRSVSVSSGTDKQRFSSAA